MKNPIQEEFDIITEFLGTTAVNNEVTFGVTVDGQGKILELIKSDSSGTYIRNLGKWEAIDPDADEEDNTTVFNQSWYEVRDTFMLYYDHYSMKKDHIAFDEITDFLVL